MSAPDTPPPPPRKRRNWLLLFGIVAGCGFFVWVLFRWVFVPRLTFVEIREAYGKRLAILRLDNWSTRTIGYHRRELGYTDTTFQLLRADGWETKPAGNGRITTGSAYRLEPGDSAEIAMLLVCGDQTKVTTPFKGGVWVRQLPPKFVGKLPASVRNLIPAQWVKVSEVQIWTETITP